MELLTNELIDRLIREIKKAKQEIFIISPYVTKEAVECFVPYCKGKKLVLNLVTEMDSYVPPKKEFISDDRANLCFIRYLYTSEDPKNKCLCNYS